MRPLLLLATLLVALALPISASALVVPVAQVEEDGGSGGTTCKWNPYWQIQCAVADCWWVGRFEWYDLSGNTTGNQCA